MNVDIGILPFLTILQKIEGWSKKAKQNDTKKLFWRKSDQKAETRVTFAVLQYVCTYKPFVLCYEYEILPFFPRPLGILCCPPPHLPREYRILFSLGLDHRKIVVEEKKRKTSFIKGTVSQNQKSLKVVQFLRALYGHEMPDIYNFLKPSFNF